MIKNILASIFFLFAVSYANAQPAGFPVKEYISAQQNPLVLYVTGDGGFNSFSTDLCVAINKAGFTVSALNAKSYFWEKKTPKQAAADILSYISASLKRKKNQQVILVGYSFGADVLPFIVNILPDSVKGNIISLILLSPSTSTDFEIHISDMFGGNKKRDMDVVAEINKLGMQKTVIISGGDEIEFPVKKIRLKNFFSVMLPGGHHYDGNTGEVANTLMRYFR